MSLITKHSGQRLYLKIIDKNITAWFKIQTHWHGLECFLLFFDIIHSTIVLIIVNLSWNVEIVFWN